MRTAVYIDLSFVCIYWPPCFLLYFLSCFCFCSLMCTLFISCNNVYEKFVILYTCLFGSERTPPQLILNLQVSLMPLVPTICLFWSDLNTTVLGIHNVAPNFSQASL